MKVTVYCLIISVIGENFVRNRGYKYIISNNNAGFLLFCINGPWINQMLKERNIDPKEFRALNWRDIALAQSDINVAKLFERLRPQNFWQMCDVFALSMSEYFVEDGAVYEEPWFVDYPIFTREDVYEILADEGVDKSDAIKITDILGKGRFTSLNVSFRDFLELCDLSDELVDVILHCKKLVRREDAVVKLLDAATIALARKRQMYPVKNKENIKDNND